MIAQTNKNILVKIDAIDQYIAYHFYNPYTKVFYGESHYWSKFIYNIVPFISLLIILLLIYAFIIYKNNKIIKKKISIIFISFLIGPGLLVNYVFKNHWGRPRPYEVLRDGQVFQSFWKMNANKPNNNSFPSGHASVGFFLGVPFLVFSRRKSGIITSSIFGLIIGFTRIVQGGHYLSDVLICGLIVWFSAELILLILME